MNFNQWIHKHTRSVLFIMLVLALGGALAAMGLPVALFPRVSFPRIVVSVDSGQQPARRMAVAVTYPVEQAVRSIPNVRSVAARTGRGSCELKIGFAWGSNMAQALLEVDAQINGILNKLPAHTSFHAKRMDTTNFPVLGYSLISSTVSPSRLRTIAKYELQPLLSTVRGVARVQVQGGAIPEYHVIVDPTRLQVFNMTLADVSQALSAANVLSAVGKFEDHDKLYLIISNTSYRSIRQIQQVVLRTGSNGLVRLGDVATVKLATRPQWIRVDADGHPAVLLQVFQQPGGNTVRIAHAIKSKIAGFKKTMPAGIQIATWYNQSQLILASAASVRDAVIIGIILAIVVLLLFLRNWKITLIAALVVPAVLSSTILLLYVFHMTFNIMTLGGMAAAVGLIIDDAIVMVEHIVRRIRGAAGDQRGRIIKATREFTGPLAGSSTSTMIIFAPLAFLSGVTGAFFKALSLTMAASLLISFFMAWLAVPVLAARFLNQRDADQPEGGRITANLHRVYGWIMVRILRAPVLVLAVLIPILVLGFAAYENVGSGFMPHMDEGGFILNYVANPGTSTTETNRLLLEVEKIISANKYVDTFSRRTGLQLGGGATRSYTGDFFIRLKGFPRPPTEQIMAAIRQTIHQRVPGLKIDTAQMMQDLIGDLTAVPQPIEIKIFSDHGPLLTSQALKVKHAISQIPGVVEVRSGIQIAGDALQIRVNRVKAALQGMTAGAITAALREYLSGTVTTRIQRGPRMIGVRVWVPHADRATEQDIGNLLLCAPDGHLFPLKEVATIETLTGQQEIFSDNLKRMIAVTARISDRDLGSTVLAVKRVLNTPGMFPHDMYYELGGLYKQQQIAFRGLLVVMIAAVLLVFLVLLFLYEHFRVALAMLSIPLLALCCVFVGLWITHTEINVSSMMGMTMVVGIVTEVAIFYYSEYHEIGDRTPPIQRLIDAGKNRMRPIAMTTIAAILALLPLALGIGQGSQMQQPLAIAIITGLCVQLPLTLVVLPALLGIVHRVKVGRPVVY
ncbi:MAG: efflux RND transporter permease subunit [Phycisphaerae bacterium]